MPAVAAAMVCAAEPAAAAGATAFPFDETSALRFSQDAVGRRVPDYAFRDGAYRPVRLSDFRGKPLVVNFVYTSCVSTCPVVVQTLSDVVPIAREAVGEDSFAVVTIGFDSRNDTPQRMRSFQRSQGVDRRGWQFLSADAATVEALTRDLGFLYAAAPHGFDHLVQTTVLDADGVVANQIYGANFSAPMLVEPLKTLVLGRKANFSTVEGLINRVRLFCTIYDPNSGRYRFDNSIFIALGIGAASLTGLGVVLVRAWARARRDAPGH